MKVKQSEVGILCSLHVCNCVTEHAPVCCTWCKAVVMALSGTRTQQQTTWQSSHLSDSFAGEARQKRVGVSKRTFSAANCISVTVFFITLCVCNWNFVCK